MITRATRKKAHHIPALNIVSTAEQPVPAMITAIKQKAASVLLFILFLFTRYKFNFYTTDDG